MLKKAEKVQQDLENFGKSLYTHAAKSRQARLATAAVDYLDNMGVLNTLNMGGIAKAVKPNTGKA